MQSEEVHVEKSGITFVPVSSEEESMAQTLIPKVITILHLPLSSLKLFVPILGRNYCL